MEMSRQLQAPTDLLPGKEPAVPTMGPRAGLDMVSRWKSKPLTVTQ